ncbi:MAG: hypothetical protein QOF62_915 [Pyrinomonadaceae bacterium]|nr:hypothetical protein [Pyrinomonadaceae bacterium]
MNNFYRGAYVRDATSTEIQQQRDALNAAAAQSQAAVQSQAETFGRSLFAGQVNDSSISDTQFVTNLYEAFLQRGPDAGGLGWWSGQATVGTGRQNVLGAFAGCPAFRDLSGTLYREANWLVSDHLGTPRMIANKSGSLASMKRHDYLPFGEELVSGTGGRTIPQGYNGDSVRQKFTAKEHDTETGLDYFLARYYSSTQGRFTSPDEFTGGPDELYYFVDDAAANPTFYADLRKPQSLNKYQYAFNNPLRYVDPDGHDADSDPDPDPPQGQGRSTTGTGGLPVPLGPGITPQEAQQTIDALQRLNRAIDDALYPISQLIGTAAAGAIDPIITTPTMPTPLPTTGTLPRSPAQPMPPPPPIEAEHKKGKGRVRAKSTKG